MSIQCRTLAGSAICYGCGDLDGYRIQVIHGDATRGTIALKLCPDCAKILQHDLNVLLLRMELTP